MRIYISGPITGQKDYKETFALAADRIEEAGHEPVNPAAELQTGHSYRYYIEKSIELLQGCDAIYMLPGWDDSTGASLEHAYAQAVGMMVYREDLGWWMNLPFDKK